MGEEGRSKRLGYYRRYNSREVNKCGKVEDTLGASCNKDIMRKKSIRKQGISETQGLKIRRGKVKPI